MASAEDTAPPSGGGAPGKPTEGMSGTKLNQKNKKKNKSKGSKKKKKKGGTNVPKPGEPGYLSPTQLRNARKRRAKQMKKREEAGDGSGDAADGDQKNKKRRTTKGNGAAGDGDGDDPSQKFRRNPQGAPVVQAAQKYFATKLPTADKFQVYLGPTTGWRTVSKLAVRPDPADSKKLIIGMFQPKSHAIVAVPNCSAHHPSINHAVASLTEVCNRFGVRAFDEASGTGYLRYIAMSVKRKTGRVQLSLVWNSTPYKREDGEDNVEDDEQSGGKKMLDRLLREIRRVTHFDGEQAQPNKKKRRRGKNGREEIEISNAAADDIQSSSAQQPPPFQLHSLWVHHNAQWKHSNAIFDISAPSESSWRHVCGPPHVKERLDLGTDPAHLPIALRFPPNAFRQANLDAFTGIVAAIRRRLGRFVDEEYAANGSGEDRALPSCLELYGGVGTIGLNLIDLVSSLVSSDENPNNVACFQGCVADAAWPEEVKSRATYVGKNATDMIARKHLADADVLVVDPPRKGLEEPVLSALTANGKLPKLVAYVSCGFDAFRRDCDALVGSGRWTLEHAEGHLLFPGSDAIETLAFFVTKT